MWNKVIIVLSVLILHRLHTKSASNSIPEMKILPYKNYHITLHYTHYLFKDKWMFKDGVNVKLNLEVYVLQQRIE